MHHASRIGGAGQLGEGTQDGQRLFRSFIVRDKIDDRASRGAVEKSKVQEFC